MSKYHPIHPVIAHFPISLWSLSVAIDIGSPWLGENWWAFSVLLLGVGCATAIIAMLSGLIELVSVSDDSALQDAYRHMVLMFCGFLFFLARLIVGLQGWDPQPPDKILLLLDLMGFLCLTIGGWYGGSLVYKHGVGGSSQSGR